MDNDLMKRGFEVVGVALIVFGAACGVALYFLVRFLLNLSGK